MAQLVKLELSRIELKLNRIIKINPNKGYIYCEATGRAIEIRGIKEAQQLEEFYSHNKQYRFIRLSIEIVNQYTIETVAEFIASQTKFPYI
jgi:uncharacterized pyridoxamine 5'-phosphate oxidase family protein